MTAAVASVGGPAWSGRHANVVDKDGLSPLMHEAFKGNVAAVRRLLSDGADPNMAHARNQYTPLMFGVMSGSTGVVGQLLASGADVGAVNCRRKSALELAMFIGHHECATLIREFAEERLQQ